VRLTGSLSAIRRSLLKQAIDQPREVRAGDPLRHSEERSYEEIYAMLKLIGTIKAHIFRARSSSTGTGYAIISPHLEKISQPLRVSSTSRNTPHEKPGNRVIRNLSREKPYYQENERNPYVP
jgi:hypothetical protein